MNGTRRLFFVVGLALVILAPRLIRADYAPNLPSSPALYAFLMRLDTRYSLGLPRGMFDQPVNAADVRAALTRADSLLTAGALTDTESEEFKSIKRILSGQSALYSWTGKRADIEGHAHLELRADLAGAYNTATGGDSLWGSGILGAGLSGAFGRVAWYSLVTVASDYRNEPFSASSFQPYDGVAYTLYGRADSSNFRASDMIRGGLVYAGEHLSMETAIDQLRLGPAVYNPLVLSAQTPPMVYARARLDLRLATYSHVFGLLRSQKDLDKYLYLHRLEVPVRKWHLTVGINEISISGSTTSQVIDSDRPVYYEPQSRSIEWVYLIPFIPFSVAEHYLGDRDNSGVSFDLNLAWPRGWRWYAEMFLDDITAPWTLFSDDWGNKWALNVGVQWFGDIRGRNLTATLEYSHVEPWVYTHFYGGSNNFTHFGQGIGAQSGPNSDNLDIAVEFAVAPRHTIGLTFRNTRKGVTRGSDIDDVFQDTTGTYVPLYPDSWTKEFLGEGYYRSSAIGALYRFAPFGRFRIEAEAQYDFSNLGNRLAGAVRGGFVW